MKNLLQLTESISTSQRFDFPNCSNALLWSALINGAWSITSGSASASNRLCLNGMRSFHWKRDKKKRKFGSAKYSAGGIKRQHLYVFLNYHWGASLHLVSRSRAERLPHCLQTGVLFRPKCAKANTCCSYDDVLTKRSEDFLKSELFFVWWRLGGKRR